MEERKAGVALEDEALALAAGGAGEHRKEWFCGKCGKTYGPGELVRRRVPGRSAPAEVCPVCGGGVTAVR